MRSITEQDIRKCGLIPAAHWSTKGAKQLFTRLLEKYNEINVSYKHCINAQKRQWEWKTYKFLSLNNNDCLLQEICRKPLTEEQKELFKQKLLNDETIDFEEFQGEEYLSDKITRINVVDICNCEAVYQARIEVA